MPRHAACFIASTLAASCALMLSGCGGGGSGGSNAMALAVAGATETPARGTALTAAPDRVIRLSADEFKSLIGTVSTGEQLLRAAGDPKCGIDVRYLQYQTVGAQGESVPASAAIMLPSGTDPACNGPRPLVLYGHGTATERNYDISNLSNTNQPAGAEGVVVAAMFAAQGYIVVAPNYAGYDKSSLPYHPFLNADQQGKEMIDALKAARSTLAALSAVDGGALLVTGYSEGGYAALAAHREMQATGMSVTASAPMSAPSAISLLIDYSAAGSPELGSTVFFPMLTTSWQKQFGNVYTAPSDIYEDKYASGIDTLLPSYLSSDELLSSGKLPKYAFFPADATPGPLNASVAINYGADNLVRQSYLTTWFNDVKANPCPGNALPATPASLNTTSPLGCAPTTGLRKAAVANDLRNWLPTRPVLMCGGANDPTVNFTSSLATSGYFRARGMPASSMTVVDLETTDVNDAYAAARAGFAQAKAQERAGASGTDAAKDQAVALAYHGQLVPAYCMQSARVFFEGVLAAGS
ncbi:prolyl oligopeptidase family serine peptidase [Variovorax sp. J22R24]|uniref:alpha/beta hydrolase family protein n=1 Tax=Variovorax gracilis TaxID=3053502 RepID=UPI002576F2D7|nr:prolyl oligopeptidase family serine peptidase [Variovorax sp. J22R24]MDM0107154.1 prolyl oligopeptidase family serine peptidase [Variovorax sp. J22R24]